MSINKIKIIIIALLCTFLFLPRLYSGEDRNLYSQGKKSARHGKIDFAFLSFDRLVRKFPHSKFANEALFAVGEYYFFLRDYRNAKIAFTRLASDYPDSEISVFTFAYLLKLAKREDDKEMIKELEDKIIGFKQVRLVFKDSKEYEYTSALFKKYKVVYFIDKVEIYIKEIYINDEAFETILF
jgi:outer membrane protein assembly factor BamD (BamD/ComL family)